MPTANVNGIELYYELYGTGAPLVLLHGGLQTIDLCFGDVLPALAASRRVIAVELQGHGHTPDAEREFTFDHLADDLVALLDHLGVDRAGFFGFSMGGLTALRTAMRHPDRVERLVVASAHFRRDGYHDGIFTGERADLLPSEQDFAAMADAYVEVAPDPGHFAAFAAKASAAVEKVDWSADEVRTITAPTLIVVGDNDFVRIEHATLMRDLIAGAQLAVLPGTTHMAVVGDELVPLVDRFLR